MKRFRRCFQPVGWAAGRAGDLGHPARALRWGFLGLLATIEHEAADTDDDDGANGHGGHVVALGLLLGGLFLFDLGLGYVLIGEGLVGVGDGLDQAVVVGIVVARDELLGEILLLEVVAHFLSMALHLR